ncbi:hypothetical protein F4810DRAFT_708714 [Camillea tinctor]|nr:hypothetical protein F4810DRAFT_708714 [Camillea tinctor]
MASPSSIVRSPPTCLNCLRNLARSPTTISLTQTRARTTKAELEDLQGIPVRLLRDIPFFGRRHAIIRVKPGRMRNIWFPKSAAEYMTAKRFEELGLTEAAIGVRDRNFGSKLMLEEAARAKEREIALREERKRQEIDREMKMRESAAPIEAKVKKEVLTLLPDQAQILLESLLPSTLTFQRKVVPAPAPAEPVPPPMPRSPSLAAHAVTSLGEPAPPAGPPAEQPIFGSVSVNDILAHVRETLLAGDAQRGSRVHLEPTSLEIVGLADGEDRIKRLGTFEVLISPGKGYKAVKRSVSVVADE